MKNIWKKINPTDPSTNGEISFIIDNEKDSLFEVVRAKNNLPEWWYPLSKSFNNNGISDLSLKSCIPFLDSLTSGYFLVLKKDIYIEYDRINKKMMISSEFLNLKENFSRHSIEQADTMPISDEYVNDTIFKWSSKFLIKTPQGYSCLFIHPLNSPNLPFYTFSGIVETDKYFMPVLFPFLMKNNYTGVIKSGTPIVQIIPFKREPWKMKKYLFSEKFSISVGSKKNEYLKKRKEKDGKIFGGVYKKEYRERKEFL